MVWLPNEVQPVNSIIKISLNFMILDFTLVNEVVNVLILPD